MIPVIDLHCDTIMALYQKKENELKSNSLQIDINKLKEGNYLAQVFAMFVFLKGNDNPFKVCDEMIDLFYSELEKNKDEIKLALTYDEVIKNHEQGLVNAILSIEEGGVIDGVLSNVDYFYERGVRMICLNWNFINGIGHPNFVLSEKPDFTKPNTEQGLTPFGIDVVKRMEKLGMIIDVSHLSDKGFWDVFNNTTKPFIASHSNSRSVCNHVRNLTDDMILALKKNGGVMGINYCQDFISEENKHSSIEDIIKHINHIVKVGGIDIVGLGSDFDGIDPDIELKDASFLTSLEDALVKEGYSNEDIEKIMYKNVLRVFENVLK